jgi:hypothetical protein
VAPIVRVRDQLDGRDGWKVLREKVVQAGPQVTVASRAGMSLQRLNQLVTGTALKIDARLAGKLEDVLGVPRGTYFEADEVLRPYVGGSTTESPPPGDAEPTA